MIDNNSPFDKPASSLQRARKSDHQAFVGSRYAVVALLATAVLFTATLRPALAESQVQARERVDCIHDGGGWDGERCVYPERGPNAGRRRGGGGPSVETFIGGAVALGIACLFLEKCRENVFGD